MYEFQDVAKTYSRGRRTVRALDGVSVRIETGEFVAVMGPSGSGKSTLLSLAGLLDVPTSGDVLIEGRSTRALNETERTMWRRKRIGFVFQFFNLLPTMTVEQNVALPLLLDGRAFRDVQTSVREWIERVGLGKRASHLPEEMSGGELQRAALARALVSNPQILLADEPTGSLDSATGDAVMALIRDLARQDGRTVVLITHDRHVAGYASRLLKLKDGRVDESLVAAI
jgi:putative ABC transport system ATP-binding protein